MAKKRNIDIYKVGTAVVITAIIVFALAAFVFKYYPEIKKENEIKAYKKAAYSTILCQYKCPLTPQFVPQVNRTEAVPDNLCAQNCTLSLMNIKTTNFKPEDLLNDNLAFDIQNTLKTCKAESVIPNSTKQTPLGSTVSTAMFFSCAIRNLESLKENYDYLK